MDGVGEWRSRGRDARDARRRRARVRSTKSSVDATICSESACAAMGKGPGGKQSALVHDEDPSTNVAELAATLLAKCVCGTLMPRRCPDSPQPRRAPFRARRADLLQLPTPPRAPRERRASTRPRRPPLRCSRWSRGTRTRHARAAPASQSDPTCVPCAATACVRVRRIAASLRAGRPACDPAAWALRWLTRAHAAHPRPRQREELATVALPNLLTLLEKSTDGEARYAALGALPPTRARFTDCAVAVSRLDSAPTRRAGCLHTLVAAAETPAAIPDALAARRAQPHRTRRGGGALSLRLPPPCGARRTLNWWIP